MDHEATSLHVEMNTSHESVPPVFSRMSAPVDSIGILVPVCVTQEDATVSPIGSVGGGDSHISSMDAILNTMLSRCVPLYEYVSMILHEVFLSIIVSRPELLSDIFVVAYVSLS